MSLESQESKERLDTNLRDLEIKADLYKKPVKFQQSEKANSISKAVFISVQRKEDPAAGVDELDSIDNFKMWQQ